jgi:hypothetical protein
VNKKTSFGLKDQVFLYKSLLRSCARRVGKTYKGKHCTVFGPAGQDKLQQQLEESPDSAEVTDEYSESKSVELWSSGVKLWSSETLWAQLEKEST